MRKALLLLALLPAAAQASTVRVTTGTSGHRTVRFAAAPGERNFVDARFGEDDITLHDWISPIAAGDGCTADDDHTVRCPAARLVIDLGDGDDHAMVECALGAGLCGSATLRGGPGDDRLRGTVQPDILDGGPGADVLDGGGAGDVLRGGAGNDYLVSGEIDVSETSTRMFCGPGLDTIGPVAIIGLDCEAFDSILTGLRGRLTARGHRLTIAIRHAPCPYAFRWGDRVTGPGRRTTFHPYGWSKVTLRIPDTGPSPHLELRALCSKPDPYYRLFARIRDPFWHPAT